MLDLRVEKVLLDRLQVNLLVMLLSFASFVQFEPGGTGPPVSAKVSLGQA